jgi:hypothetical protein
MQILVEDNGLQHCILRRPIYCNNCSALALGACALTCLGRCRAMSSVEFSHHTAVTDLHWLPGVDITRDGRANRSAEGRSECSFFATTAGDGKVAPWCSCCTACAVVIPLLQLEDSSRSLLRPASLHNRTDSRVLARTTMMDEPSSKQAGHCWFGWCGVHGQVAGPELRVEHFLGIVVAMPQLASSPQGTLSQLIIPPRPCLLNN